MVYGIDPGYTGGIVGIDDLGKVTNLATIPLTKDDDVDFVRLSDIFQPIHKYDTIVLEDVHSVFGASAKSNFQFGRICGILRAYAEQNCDNVVMITPKQWQQLVWIDTDKVLKPNGKVDTKATSLKAAQRLFRNVNFLATAKSKKPHNGLIDAALIAYAHEQNKG